MTQTLLLVVLFVGAMAALPWLVRRLQQRQAGLAAASGTTSRVVSAVGVGPQQRVVTVEVGPEHARTWLVLGVTPQQIQCLHVLVPPPAARPADPAAVQAFAQALGEATASAQGGAHGR